MRHRSPKRHQTHKFYCPCCEQRLWRLGSEKYYLLHPDKPEIKKELEILPAQSRSVSSLSTFVDYTSWIEEFFCEAHGTIWMRISQKMEPGSLLQSQVASDFGLPLESNSIYS